MDLDRQSVERRDFPVSRRGYDPAAVDAHLRALAGDVEELERTLDERGGESLGSAAGTQVQSILEAAEATAADIERQAAEQARSTRDAADRDAQRTRDEAVAQARAHVQAVSQATAVLLERVESMDSEVGSLVQSLRSGAGRLAADLGAVERNMGELYDAASGAAGGAGAAEEPQVPPLEPVHVEPPAAPRGAESTAVAPPPSSAAPTQAGGGTATPAAKAPGNGSEPATAAEPVDGPPAPSAGEDLDGARLIALNMALNGEPREQADRYLANHFALSDREKLLDEVYAAIEG